MRKKIIGIIMVLFALNMVFISKAQNVPVLYQTSFMRSMQATGSEVSGAYFRGTGSLEEVWQSNITWPGLCRQLAVNCGFSENAIQKAAASWQGDGSFKWQLRESDRLLDILFIPSDNMTDNNIIKVDYRLPISEELDFQQANQQIHEIMRNLSAKPVIYTCLKGYIDGKLKSDGLKRSLEDGFASIGAEIINRYETPVGFYYSGAAPYLIEDTADSTARPLDIGIDAHYEAESGRTVYKIGSADLFRLAGL